MIADKILYLGVEGDENGLYAVSLEGLNLPPLLVCLHGTESAKYGDFERRFLKEEGLIRYTNSLLKPFEAVFYNSLAKGVEKLNTKKFIDIVPYVRLHHAFNSTPGSLVQAEMPIEYDKLPLEGTAQRSRKIVELCVNYLSKKNAF